MLHSPSPALRFLVINTAMVILRDTAVVVRVAIGDVGVATDAGEPPVGTNVPTHIMITIIVTMVSVWTYLQVTLLIAIFIAHPITGF